MTTIRHNIFAYSCIITLTFARLYNKHFVVGRCYCLGLKLFICSTVDVSVSVCAIVLCRMAHYLFG